MTYSPLTIKRSHVLGELYKRCERVESIPVYLNDASGELLGYVDECLGHYADAFSFHLEEDVCKKLSSSGYNFAFDYEMVDTTTVANNRSRIKLKCILLIARKSVEKKVVVI